MPSLRFVERFHERGDGVRNRARAGAGAPFGELIAQTADLHGDFAGLARIQVRLAGHLEHFSYRNLDDHLARMHRYAVLMADEMFRAGKRRGFGTVLINPAWRFLRGMILKRGFLDGWRGLAFHLIEARYVREKYLRAWLATRSEGRAFVRGSAAAKPGSEAPHAGTQPALRRTAL